MTHSNVVLTLTGIAAVCLLTASVLLAETPAATDQPGGVTPAPVEPAAAAVAENTESIRASRQLNDAYRESFAPPTVGDQKLDNELQTLIDKINAMSLPEAAPATRPATSPQRPKPGVTPAPVEGDTATDSEQTAEMDKTQDADEQPRKLGPPEQLPIPPPVLKALAEKQPGTLADPLRLADTLFAGGHYAEAATVYQQQLDKADADTDQAWLIYQIANCKADSDRTEAISLYRRIGAEFPNSPWAPLAKTNLELLQWMDQNQPREFLRDLATELNAISKTEHIAKQ